MESTLIEAHSSREMSQKLFNHMSMLGRRSTAPRPLSEATMIFDTDDEDDTGSSPSSLVYDSQSTLSAQDDLPTPPDTAGLGGFEFHFDPTPVKGPVGPHLFRTGSTDSTQEILGLSPVPVQKTETRRVSSLPAAVAQLDETQVRDWSPKQVADWMADAGFEASIVDKFVIHDIYGSVLLDLQFEDLKEIDIESFGKRRRIMSSIQRLRDSSMIASDTHVSLSTSPVSTGNALSRAPRDSELHVVASKKPKSRRGRHAYNDIITPAESVSIVAIEQVLPEPHICAKGENCSKWRKQQRKIERIKQAFAAEEAEQLDARSTVAPSTVAPSIVGPSVTGSSDVLGPVALPITAERLNHVQARDAQENVRQFLDFQSTQRVKDPSPPPAPSATFAAKSAQKLQGLPRLRIPSMVNNSDSPDRTPISALRNPTQIQADLKAALRSDPYHYGGVASPVDVYRVETPMSTTDIPVTALPIDPCQRDISQSVPPEMRFGSGAGSGSLSASTIIADPVQRCCSVSPPRRRQPPFMPTVPAVVEAPPVVTSEVELANHAGWMRKRKTTRMLRHEWQDHYFYLNGSRLDMHPNEVDSTLLDSIDVDEYDIHAYTTASGSKLKSAFAKATGGDKEPSFAFTLIPEDQKDKKLFEKSRNHHFAVNSGRDRVEWMRRLMLAKAMKKNVMTAI